jgi:hypothetical protein
VAPIYNLSTWEVEVGRVRVQSQLRQSLGDSVKNQKTKGLKVWVRVEHLLSKLQALGSSPAPSKTETRKNLGDRVRQGLSTKTSRSPVILERPAQATPTCVANSSPRTFTWVQVVLVIRCQAGMA